MHCKTTLIALLFSFLLPINAQEPNSTNQQGQIPANQQEQNTINAQQEDSTKTSWEETIKLSLSRLAEEADKAYWNTGISVWDLTADSLLFSYNSHKAMRPASTQKTVTAITALSLLGANHEYHTNVYYTGEITPDSILNGDLYVVGDFDPSLTYGDVKSFASNIKNYGIRSINGTIFGDATMKELDLYGSGWCWDDVPCSNMPYLCALMFERGKIGPDYSKYSKDLYFNPAEYFAKTLANELIALGINGNIRVGANAMPSSANAKFITSNTKTIGQLLTTMMKKSDNFYAESMFYQLANEAAGKNCSWKDGVKQVEKMLDKIGVGSLPIIVADGSGVSLYNYISPDIEVALLRYAYKDSNIYSYLYPSLPIAGVDGTLSSRMTSGTAYNNIHAKTGTVTGCSCLCGYATASNGHLLAFSIMNNGVMKAAIGRTYQDRVCQELTR